MVEAAFVRARQLAGVLATIAVALANGLRAELRAEWKIRTLLANALSGIEVDDRRRGCGQTSGDFSGRGPRSAARKFPTQCPNAYR